MGDSNISYSQGLRALIRSPEANIRPAYMIKLTADMVAGLNELCHSDTDGSNIQAPGRIIGSLSLSPVAKLTLHGQSYDVELRQDSSSFLYNEVYDSKDHNLATTVATGNSMAPPQEVSLVDALARYTSCTWTPIACTQGRLSVIAPKPSMVPQANAAKSKLVQMPLKGPTRMQSRTGREGDIGLRGSSMFMPARTQAKLQTLSQNTASVLVQEHSSTQGGTDALAALAKHRSSNLVRLDQSARDSVMGLYRNAHANNRDVDRTRAQWEEESANSSSDSDSSDEEQLISEKTSGGNTAIVSGEDATTQTLGTTSTPPHPVEHVSVRTETDEQTHTDADRRNEDPSQPREELATRETLQTEEQPQPHSRSNVLRSVLEERQQAFFTNAQLKRKEVGDIPPNALPNVPVLAALLAPPKPLSRGSAESTNAFTTDYDPDVDKESVLVALLQEKQKKLRQAQREQMTRDKDGPAHRKRSREAEMVDVKMPVGVPDWVWEENVDSESDDRELSVDFIDERLWRWALKAARNK